MKTFNKNFTHFLNKLEFGEEIAEKIQKKEYNLFVSNFLKFTSLNYLEQIKFIIYILDNPQFDIRDALKNNKNSDYIKKIINLLGGRNVKNLPCVKMLFFHPKNRPENFTKISLPENFISLPEEFSKLDFNTKIELCIYFLTLDMNGGQKDVYTEYIINHNREYRELYEMMEIIAEIIEKNESFLIESEVINHYNALERDRKIDEIFED